MQIKYRLVATYPDEHQIKVRFYSDLLPEVDLVSAWMPDGVTPASYRTDYMLTLPIPAPTGAALDAFVLMHCPVYWFDLKRQIADSKIDTSLSAIVPLTGNVVVLNAPVPSEAAPLTLTQAKEAKNTLINQWRSMANETSFTFLGKHIASDILSKWDILTANSKILNRGALPGDWFGGWKTIDNSLVLIPTVAVWKDFIDAMYDQGTTNFTHAQTLKSTLAAATSIEQVNSIVW